MCICDFACSVPVILRVRFWSSAGTCDCACRALVTSHMPAVVWPVMRLPADALVHCWPPSVSACDLACSPVHVGACTQMSLPRDRVGTCLASPPLLPLRVFMVSCARAACISQVFVSLWCVAVTLGVSCCVLAPACDPTRALRQSRASAPGPACLHCTSLARSLVTLGAALSPFTSQRAQTLSPTRGSGGL